ncbi:GCN5-related N-acetyltransferase [Apiospora kogelbergensis]|uniref:GCN5-related N-acetyltransferase n=1 Tax=Apiospora kogelbergensis TaxID=1337665 RepID=A0AAW0R3R3_9PEZI
MATNTGLPSFTIRAITPSETHDLRHSVLWPDKPLSYIQLDEDDEGHHFAVFIEGSETPLLPPNLAPHESSATTVTPQEQEKPVSIISVFFADAANQKKEARFRKFATDPKWQGRGVGSALLRYAIVFAVTEGAESIWCDARTSALGFYQRFGLDAEGEEFLKGDVPYMKMSRTLP